MLCDMAKEAGVVLEDISNALVMANAVAIGEGVYTKTQALQVIVMLRKGLDNPVSYLFFQKNLKGYLDRYPGLLQVAHFYIDRFTSTRIMYRTDQELLIRWLDNQIEALI